MQDRTALVVGLGRFGGGVASIRHLGRHDYQIRVTDRATEEDLKDSVAALVSDPKLSEQIEWRLGEDGQDPGLLHGIELLVCNPGVPDQHPLLELARQQGIAITQEANLFLESYPGKVVVVTGTNGKSTTATLLANALRRCGINTLLGGNIGHSLLEDHAIWSAEQVAVLELSSFQLERVDPAHHQVTGTVLTRVTSDHLDRHGDLQTYQAAKAQAAAMARDFLVRNADDRVAAGFDHQAKEVLLHGPHNADHPNTLAASTRDGSVWSHLSADSGPVLTVQAIDLPGRFQTENIMAAFLAAMQLSQNLAGDTPCRHAIAIALASTQPLANRLQLSATIDGRQIFGNAVSTQVDSTLSAIDSLPGRIHWVGGGKSKDYKYQQPGSQLSRRIASAHLFGAVASPMAQVMSGQVMTSVHEHLEQALDAAWDASEAGDTILFSPAFASFDQFPNFATRARRFDSWVRCLQKETVPSDRTCSDLPAVQG
jgi:UDP-N-acetylmuramoylalanine--D-glutamate ligase